MALRNLRRLCVYYISSWACCLSFKWACLKFLICISSNTYWKKFLLPLSSIPLRSQTYFNLKENKKRRITVSPQNVTLRWKASHGSSNGTQNQSREGKWKRDKLPHPLFTCIAHCKNAPCFFFSRLNRQWPTIN